MIEKAYQKVIGVIEPIMSEKGYEQDKENNYYIVENRAVKVEYNKDSQVYELKVCSYSDGEADNNWKVISAWLFDENSDDKDVNSLCNDFEYTLKEEFKLNAVKPRFVEKGSPSTATNDIDIFTQKFLAFYPQYKEAYNEMLDKYKVFLPEEFFVTYGREKLLELMDGGNKKSIEKMAKFLSGFYEESNPEVRSIITSTILTGLIGYEGSEKSFEYLFDGLSEITARNTKTTLKLYKNRK